MKISQLIEVLQAAQAEHGDLEVVDDSGLDGWGHFTIDGQVEKTTVYKEDDGELLVDSPSQFATGEPLTVLVLS